MVVSAEVSRLRFGTSRAWAVHALQIHPVSIPLVTTIVAMNLKLSLAACAVCTAALVWHIAADGSNAPRHRLAYAVIEGEPKAILDPLEVMLDTKPQRERATHASTA